MTHEPDPILYIPAPRKDRSWDDTESQLLDLVTDLSRSGRAGILPRYPKLRNTCPVAVHLDRSPRDLQSTILWSGAGVSAADLANNPARTQVLLLSSADVDDIVSQTSGFRRAFVEVLDAMERVILQDWADLQVMAHKFPAYAAAFMTTGAVSPGDGVMGYAGLTRSAWDRVLATVRSDHRVVICFRDGALTGTAPKADGDRVSYFGLVSAGEISEADVRSCPYLPVLAEEPGKGPLESRRAAWQLLSAARRVGATTILTDDPELAVRVCTDEEFGRRVWFVLDEGRQVDERVVAAVQACRRTVCFSESRRAELEAFSGGVPANVSVVPATVMAPDERPAPAGAWSVALESIELLVRSYNALQHRGDHERTVVIAGHDFKFMGELVDALRAVPRLDVAFDKWPQQNRRDVAQSDTALRQADIIVCEFASHNAVWYSWNKRPGQRLIVHFHGYEFFQPWIADINVPNVDCFVFVSDFFRRKVVEELGWPPEKTRVVPNVVDVLDLDRPKNEDARFHLGIVGIVPILKRPDRALDLLECLLEQDDRYVLHVRGRHPWEYQWMWRDPATRDAYEAFYERLSADARLLRHVAFDGFGPDMGRWYRRIGWVLSPSYRETFHLAPVEGMPGGAVPVVWAREGAVEVFGEDWVHATTQECADFITRHNVSEAEYSHQAQQAREFVRRYGLPEVLPRWNDVLFDETDLRTPEIDSRFTAPLLAEQFASETTASVLERYILLLARDRDVETIECLLDSHPRLASQLSHVARERVDEVRAWSRFTASMACLPARSHGTAYEPRRGTGVVVRSRVDDGGPARLTVSGLVDRDGAMVADGDVRDLELPLVNRDPDTTESVHLHADALLRDCRVRRPGWIAAESTLHALWPALLAGRRLGLPVISIETGSVVDPVDWTPDASAPDAVVSSEEALTPDVVAGAWERFSSHVALNGTKQLKDLRLGIIADEFTTRTISSCCSTVRIHRERGYVQMAAEEFDALLVESAWEGPDREWFHGVAYYKDEREDIERIIEIARARGIPVIFWNKEDPVHFKSFAPTAMLCDAVFTTDADKVPDYLGLRKDNRPWAVGSMPFFAEPSLHNPLPGDRQYRHTVTYAGTYYGARYAERSAELDKMLERAAEHGLTIYDRQVNIPNSPYHFPQKYERFIEGGLSYSEMLQAYKAHPVHLNVNSASASPTMFSRRAVEIAASGAVVLSGTGRGLNECLPAVLATAEESEWADALQRWMASPTEWSNTAWAQLREVRRAYLAEHALLIMLRTAGVNVAASPRCRYAAVVDQLDIATAEDLLAQTWPPTRIVARTVEEGAALRVRAAGITVSTDADPLREDWVVQWQVGLDPNYAEDVLYAARFLPGQVPRIGARRGTGSRALLEWGSCSTMPVFQRCDGSGDADGQDDVDTYPVWIYPGEDEQ